MEISNSTIIDHMDHATFDHDSCPACDEVGACKAVLDFTEQCTMNMQVENVWGSLLSKLQCLAKAFYSKLLVNS